MTVLADQAYTDENKILMRESLQYVRAFACLAVFIRFSVGA